MLSKWYVTIHGRAQFAFKAKNVMKSMFGQAHKQSDDQYTI